ncbi:MAG TPA: DPP IV N-terminal domain-containing protein [Pyrinomonadaceae bacterium]
MPGEAPDAAPAWTFDGENLIVAAGTTDNEICQIVEINLAGGETAIKTNQSFYFINSLKLLASNELIVSAMENKRSKLQIFRVDLNNGEVSPVTDDLSQYESVSISPKNNRLLTIQITDNFHLWLYDAETGSARQLTFGENRFDGMSGIAFAPDLKILYTAREKDETNLFEFNPETNETRQLTRHAGRNFEPAVSPDGQSIVFVSDRTGVGRLWLMNRDGSNARRLTQSADDKRIFDRTPNFSPDGRFVYYISYASPLGMIYKISIDGGTPERFLPEEKGIALPAVSPDGKWLSIGDTVNDTAAKIGVYSLENPGEKERLFDFPAYRMFSRWLPDSKTLVTINNNNDGNNLTLHNILTGEAKQITNFNAEHIERFAVSGDGRKFAIARGNLATDAVLIEH